MQAVVQSINLWGDGGIQVQLQFVAPQQGNMQILLTKDQVKSPNAGYEVGQKVNVGVTAA